MFCSRNLNHRVNRLHEKALRISHDDYSSDFEELLERDDTIPVHKRNLRKLAIRIYNIWSNLSPLFCRHMMIKNMCTLEYEINC